MAKYKQLPEPSAKLYSALSKIPHGIIPEALKEEYLHDPSLLALGDHDFLLARDTPYELSRLAPLKIIVDQILREASFNHRMNANERQWGGTVLSWLCGHLMPWSFAHSFRLLNVEQYLIEPNELHTKMPNDIPLVYSTGAESTTDNSKEKDTPEKVSDAKGGVRKMVDWCLARALDYKDEDILEKAFATIYPNECSVNQSLSYISRPPLFLDIEMKRKLQPTDPEVELAIWASGALQKKIHQGWDPRLPMPAITIEGHLWCWYMFVPKLRGNGKSSGLVILGPFPMGSTADLVSIWQIVYRLHTLIKWGTTEYSQWFQEEVMGWARGRIGIPSEGDSALSELYGKGMSIQDRAK